MFIANNNFALMPESYLFSEVARRIRAFREMHPSAEIIRMDIGDVSRPLPAAVVEALRSAASEMGTAEGFHGYGPEQGYPFLREAIAANDYIARGIRNIGADDIFVSDGAKSDVGNLGDLFGKGVSIAVAEPAYPVYVDANVMDGRAGTLHDGKWSDITYLECPSDNDFKPLLPGHNGTSNNNSAAGNSDNAPDVIYLCYPNNPTGVTLTADELKQWVDYAIAHRSLIIYDSAYEAYITDPEIPRSIYEIPGAEQVAIEVRSFSKTAGFTGVRCGYTVVPRSLRFRYADGKEASLNQMWKRRQSTKFNGVGYIVQKAAESLYSPLGREAIRESVGTYMRNARALREVLLDKGYKVVGGDNSPYIWFKASETVGSWELFDRLLSGAGISSTPGSGFGKSGEGYLRFTGFNTPELTDKAVAILRDFSF